MPSEANPSVLEVRGDQTMSTIAELAFNGLTIGMIYVILAAGLVLILSVTEIFFVAYGQFYMIGAYTACIARSARSALTPWPSHRDPGHGIPGPGGATS